MLIIHDDIKCEGENIYHNLISFLRHLLWELLEKRGERDGAMTMQAHQGEMIYSTYIPCQLETRINLEDFLPSYFEQWTFIVIEFSAFLQSQE